MLKRLTLYFIPLEKQELPEILLKYKLVVNIILITFLFDLDYALITVTIKMSEGTISLIAAAILHLLLVFAIKRNVSLLFIVNFYVLIGVSAVFISIYFSGGLNSPVLPWLATSPVVALLMNGKKTGLVWLFINSGIALYFGISDRLGYAFPLHYDLDWKNSLAINCLVGLILIVFFVSFVFESGKNSAFKKLAENSILLAEEKRKNAFHEISQEIHDGVGQTLSIIKLNLHLLEKIKDESGGKLNETVELVTKAIVDLRNISNHLYSENLHSFNLENALNDDLTLIKNIGTHSVLLNITGKPNLDPKTSFTMYRIAKEGLNNILKHANATSITITLDYSNQFSMMIQDNGVGISYKNENGQGIASMRDRISLLGGYMSIENSGGGTILKLLI
ncbi:sensor histidine kinase [Flavobacterium anhuiense]|uniref:histidine kinase n=1 Tax=Flavobacterium anhuiense TaxID=459526 RepID=A0ABY0LYB0_9FLAO|nr:histidine kinase [Flavobacterium anhuiense]SCY78697.1 Signal transduction histidine kinase [Flavobacterium anhuiense]